MTIDWNEAAKILKRDVGEHGGFLTLQRDAFRERFDIGRLAERNTEELLTTLYEYGMIVLPHPYLVAGSLLRVYDVESSVGKIALAVGYPQEMPETALVDTVKLHERAEAGKRRRSVCVPWLAAFDVFLQLVIGRTPEGWEDLDDDREPYQLVAALASRLNLPPAAADTKATACIAGSVWACRPRIPRWESAPPALASFLTEATQKQKIRFEEVLREAAVYILGGTAIPSDEVDLGSLGLRYRHEA